MLNLLPFTGKHHTVVRNKLVRFMRQLFPMAKLTVAYSPTFKIASFFKFKDEIPHLLLWIVVYKLRCSSCGTWYVSQTTRHLHTRVAGHMRVSSRTRRSVSASLFSSVREHSHRTGHVFTEKDVRIVTKARTNYDLGIMESLVIANTRTKLHVMHNSTKLSLLS